MFVFSPLGHLDFTLFLTLNWDFNLHLSQIGPKKLNFKLKLDQGNYANTPFTTFESGESCHDVSALATCGMG